MFLGLVPTGQPWQRTSWSQWLGELPFLGARLRWKRKPTDALIGTDSHVVTWGYDRVWHTETSIERSTQRPVTHGFFSSRFVLLQELRRSKNLGVDEEFSHTARMKGSTSPCVGLKTRVFYARKMICFQWEGYKKHTYTLPKKGWVDCKMAIWFCRKMTEHDLMYWCLLGRWWLM